MSADPAGNIADAHRALVLIPSYNTGALLLQTVSDARAHFEPVWVVVDGSTDGSAQALKQAYDNDPGVTVIEMPHNQGKGAALLHGMEKAREQGFTHALTMDADGQHPPELIVEFIERSDDNPDAMILGRPVFGPEAPALRTNGRKISNWWANLETLWVGIDDSLFGFRVYPIEPLTEIMRTNRWMRRFDFDVEVAVRMVWRGVRPINIDAPVRYLSEQEGGVSHFHYFRDNALLTWMHMRLFAGFVLRLPTLWLRRNKS